MTNWEFPKKYLATIEIQFPNLKSEGYKPTSPPDCCYNCIAWAAEDPDHFWSPLPNEHGETDHQYEEYWPPGIPQENTLEAWMAALALSGFEKCDSVNFESGYQKIAIYADDQGEPLHVARQLPNGKWTSKLGDECDIEHATLQALEGTNYGRPKGFMKRHLQPLR